MFNYFLQKIAIASAVALWWKHQKKASSLLLDITCYLLLYIVHFY
ncbi:hypothetical protein [Amazonocrinis nigriterrae]|nr:hypothetical protein [Amazonocrinis nigriterrae]